MLKIYAVPLIRAVADGTGNGVADKIRGDLSAADFQAFHFGGHKDTGEQVAGTVIMSGDFLRKRKSRLVSRAGQTGGAGLLRGKTNSGEHHAALETGGKVLRQPCCGLPGSVPLRAVRLIQ